MKIIDMNIKEYMDTLKTNAPAPGGGSVSGITAAQGISLTLMVLELTLGKEKYKEYEEQNQKIHSECLKIYENLLNAADNDKKAFIKLSIDAIEAPFEVMKLSFEALKLTDKIVGKSNKMASSDLGVAAECLKAASKSAWLNVKINIPYLNDEKLKKQYKNEGLLLLDKTEKLACEVYKKVEEAL